MKRLQSLLFILLLGLSTQTPAGDKTPSSSLGLQNKLEALMQENNQLQQTIGRQQRQMVRQRQELDNAAQLQKKLDILSDHIQNDLQTLRQSQPYHQDKITDVQKALLDSPKPSERFLTSLALMQDELDASARLTTWSGELENGHKVDFIKLGRVALYYLTPDAQEGALYIPAKKQWQGLEMSETMELVKARNMALMEQAGDWLYLPLPRTRKEE